MAIRRCKFFKFLLDALIVITVLLVAFFSYIGWFPIDKQGFYCNDESIRYAFRGDTVKMSVLITVFIFVPIFVIPLVEFWHNCRRPDDESPIDDVIQKPSAVSVVDDRRLSTCLRCFRNVYGIYAYGGLCGLAIVEFLKIAVGELRPHFLDTCKPNFSKINCSHGYITEYTCMGTEPIYRLMDSYKSFPSGHAAGSVYMSLFLCVYIRRRLFPHPTCLSSSMLQAILVIWPVYCSMSRVVDRRHHWWDVVAGLIIGVIMGCYSVYNLVQTVTRPAEVPVPDFLLSSSLRKADALGTFRHRHYGSCEMEGDLKIIVAGISSTSQQTSSDHPTTSVEVVPIKDNIEVHRIVHGKTNHVL